MSRPRCKQDVTGILWTLVGLRVGGGRGVTVEGGGAGRDHHPGCSSLVMAGGGVKPGISHGASDELGFSVAENKVHIYDLQATIMHLLGFDHEKLTVRYQGRDFRLTDVHGSVVKGLLA